MANYLVHYTSADGPGNDATWSVYREEYVNLDAPEPIDGATTHVSTHATESLADTEAHRLQIAWRLEYLRGLIRAGCISYGELAELQSLSDHIEFGDVELLQWAGVSEEDARAEGRI